MLPVAYHQSCLPPQEPAVNSNASFPFIFPANLEVGKWCCIVYGLVLGGNMSPPMSNSNLCHTICFVIINSSTVLVECFSGMPRPKGVLRASNYRESENSTWPQRRRHRQDFLLSPLSASGSAPDQTLSCFSTMGQSAWGLGLGWSPKTPIYPQSSKKQTWPVTDGRYLWPLD